MKKNIQKREPNMGKTVLINSERNNAEIVKRSESWKENI